MIYIKELMEAEVRERKEELESAQMVLRDREEAAKISCWDTSDDQITELRAKVAEKRELWGNAMAALEDFLNKEWN
jgi:hypothetical protein